MTNMSKVAFLFSHFFKVCALLPYGWAASKFLSSFFFVKNHVCICVFAFHNAYRHMQLQHANFCNVSTKPMTMLSLKKHRKGAPRPPLRMRRTKN